MTHYAIDISVKFEHTNYGHDSWLHHGPNADCIDRIDCMIAWCKINVDQDGWYYCSHYSQVPGEFTCRFLFKEREDLLAFKLVFEI